jgi:hypothetical protein
VEALIAADKSAQEKIASRRQPGETFHHGWNVVTEANAGSHESMTVLKTRLLLRAGAIEFAEAYWSQLSPKLDDSGGDPYLMMAQRWVWCAFDRAVCAHMRGDDIVSFAAAQVLATAQPQIEASAAERGFQRPIRMDPRNFNRELPNAPYIGFLDPKRRPGFFRLFKPFPSTSGWRWQALRLANGFGSATPSRAKYDA